MSSAEPEAPETPPAPPAQPAQPTAPRRLPMAAAWIGAAVITAPNFLYPFFEDTALYAYIGRAMGDGLLPYRDLIDQKPPAMYWLTYACDGLLGRSSAASRLFELAAIALMAWACGRICRRVVGPAGFAVGVFVTAAMSSSLFWSVAERGQVEWFQATATAWGVWFAIASMSADSRRQADRDRLRAGLFLGLACWFKPQAAIVGALVAAVLIARRIRAPDPEHGGGLRVALVVGAGALAASAPFVVWMLATGIFDDFVAITLGLNSEYLDQVARPGLSEAIERVVHVPWVDTPARVCLWVLLGAGLMVAAGVLGPHKEQRARGWPRVWPRVWIGSVVVLWLLGAFLQYLSGRFLFRYHQVILVPAAAVLLTAGLVGLAGATRRLEQRARPLLVRALSITALVAVGWFVLVNAKLVDELRVTAQWATGSVSTDEVYSRFGHRLWYYSYPDQRALAAYVHRATAPGDAVHMIGRGGLFYLYVDRRPASRYLVTKGVFDRRRPTAEARIAEFVAELERARPRYILIRRDDAFPWFGLPSSLDQVRQEPRILAFLRQHYAFEDAPFPRVVVLKRTDDGGR